MKRQPLIEWVNRHVWLDGCDLEIEYRQATEEGRDLPRVKTEFDRLLAAPKPVASRHHGWCRTSSNAQIVTIGLLYGGDDYGRTITRAVMAGFDTDCNGATCGGVWGVKHGVRALPAKWTRPMRDTVRTGMDGFDEVRICELARHMAAVAWEHRS